jgi:phospholipid transport system substrate-binding protein
MIRRDFLSIGAGTFATAMLAGSRGNAATDPVAFVGSVGTEGIQMLGSNVPAAQRAARFRQLFESSFDVGGITRFVLGRYGRELSPGEQQEFARIFPEYIAQAYSAKLGQFGGLQFRTTGLQSGGPETVVGSTVIRGGAPPMQIDWHLIDVGGQYKVTDLYIDRVSMRVTQRDEFAQIIQNNGGRAATLLAVLRQQIRG